MAAIGTGWAEAAWIEAGWIAEAWDDEINVVVTSDKGRDAGSGKGKKQEERIPAWWEGEWIIPGVTHYLPEKPPEDIIPLRPKIARVKKRVAEIPKSFIAEARKELAGLTRSVTMLERKARSISNEREIRSIDDIINRYRTIDKKIKAFEASISEKIETHKRRIRADDEAFLSLLQDMD